MKAAQTNLLKQISNALCSSGMDEQHARAAATAAAQRIRTGIDAYLHLMELETAEQTEMKER